MILGWSIGGSNLDGQGSWLLFSLLLYPFLGWLFGSYTVLRWRRLTLPAVAAACDHSGGERDGGGCCPLVDQSCRFRMAGLPACAVAVDAALTGWALLVRLALRKGLLLTELQGCCCWPNQNEIHTVLAAWQRVPHRQRLSPVDALRLQGRSGATGTTFLVAVSSEMRRDPSQRSLLETPRDARSAGGAECVGAEFVRTAAGTSATGLNGGCLLHL